MVVPAMVTAYEIDIDRAVDIGLPGEGDLTAGHGDRLAVGGRIPPLQGAMVFTLP